MLASHCLLRPTGKLLYGRTYLVLKPILSINPRSFVAASSETGGDPMVALGSKRGQPLSAPCSGWHDGHAQL